MKLKTKSNFFEQLYEKTLTAQQFDEITFNINGYIRVLIEMDKQYNECVDEGGQKHELFNSTGL